MQTSNIDKKLALTVTNILNMRKQSLKEAQKCTGIPGAANTKYTISTKYLKVNSAPNEWGVINEQIGLRSRIAYSDFDSEDPVRCYSAAKFGPCGHCLCPCFVV